MTRKRMNISGRFVAHVFGWHTNACRGQAKCWPGPDVQPIMHGRFAGWWRHPRQVSAIGAEVPPDWQPPPPDPARRP